MAACFVHADVVLSPQHTMLQLIKEALGQNGVTPRDDSPVTEVLNQVCPSSWRGACKTAVQLLFAQAGLVSMIKTRVAPVKLYLSENWTHWGLRPSITEQWSIDFKSTFILAEWRLILKLDFFLHVGNNQQYGFVQS